MSENQKVLEPFEEVFGRQEPKIVGEPFCMKVFSNDLPKICGDPWKGAYSLHGFWYKFHRGTSKDFKKLSKLSNEQNNFFVSDDSYDVWLNMYGKENLIFITVRNLRLDYIGGIIGIKKSKYCQIGFYFIQEDYRHSLIGQQLFRHAAKELSASMKPFIFQCISSILPTVSKFGLQTAHGRSFEHFQLSKPSGFADLERNKKLNVIEGFDKLSAEQMISVNRFDQQISGEDRDLRKMFSSNFSKFYSAFSQKNECVGFTVCNEILSAMQPKHLLISPLYSQSNDISEHLIYAAFFQFYNPDEDYDFDPDFNAIYRRDIHFIVPADNERLLPILQKLRGAEGSLISHRLRYQTTTSGDVLPGINLQQIDCVGDLFSSLI